MELKDYISAFADQFEDTDPNEITENTKFHDLDEWDSLIALAVLNMTEKRFGKRISFDEMKNCNTIKELFDIVVTK